MRQYFFLIALITALCLIAPLALAEVPGLVNYQGYLTDSGGDPLTDFMDMEFTIWDDAVSTDPSNLKWTETWTGAAKVLVEDGYYSALLGTYESFGAVFAENDDLWLQVQVGVETLSPRKRIASAAYAQRSKIQSCPAGFTSVEWTGTIGGKDYQRQLGCIQTGIEGTVTAQAAAFDCFTKYGGRLPSYNELIIAKANYTLTYGDTVYELIDNVQEGYYVAVRYSDNHPDIVGGSTVKDYRCWLPAR